MVIYEDGDQETLNLTKEPWELVEEEDNASDPIQEIVPGPSDLSDMFIVVLAAVGRCLTLKECDDGPPSIKTSFFRCKSNHLKSYKNIKSTKCFSLTITMRLFQFYNCIIENIIS
ncbi:uncharacterized protein LOC129893749 [Solanum dulcamara]|uniref:uncharacterized protein LOC129893749 n=1 Tax=Solanum dulcamara TaxID=45834 RepID=UPI0024853D9D|nr:uncharacterized protein LOC129893749 [Solanum dulcamara]